LKRTTKVVPDREFVCSTNLDRRTASLPRRRHADEDEHPPIAHVEEPLRLEMDRGAAPGSRIPKAAELLDTPDNRPVGVDGGEVELRIGRDLSGGRSHQTTGVCVDAAHDLDVLLRHRPPSISARSAAFHANRCFSS
jgi:hypothetical protein